MRRLGHLGDWQNHAGYEKVSKRAPNNSKKMIPYGLLWGAFTGGGLHLWNHGFSTGGYGMGLALFTIGLWGGTGLIWAWIVVSLANRRTTRSDT